MQLSSEEIIRLARQQERVSKAGLARHKADEVEAQLIPAATVESLINETLAAFDAELAVLRAELLTLTGDHLDRPQIVQRELNQIRADLAAALADVIPAAISDTKDNVKF